MSLITRSFCISPWKMSVIADYECLLKDWWLIDVHLGSCQTSMAEYFCKNSFWIETVNYIRKNIDIPLFLNNIAIFRAKHLTTNPYLPTLLIGKGETLRMLIHIAAHGVWHDSTRNIWQGRQVHLCLQKWFPKNCLYCA